MMNERITSFGRLCFEAVRFRTQWTVWCMPVAYLLFGIQGWNDYHHFMTPSKLLSQWRTFHRKWMSHNSSLLELNANQFKRSQFPSNKTQVRTAAQQYYKWSHHASVVVFLERLSSSRLFSTTYREYGAVLAKLLFECWCYKLKRCVEMAGKYSVTGLFSCRC